MLFQLFPVNHLGNFQSSCVLDARIDLLTGRHLGTSPLSPRGSTTQDRELDWPLGGVMTRSAEYNLPI